MRRSEEPEVEASKRWRKSPGVQAAADLEVRGGASGGGSEELRGSCGARWIWRWHGADLEA